MLPAAACLEVVLSASYPFYIEILWQNLYQSVSQKGDVTFKRKGIYHHTKLFLF